MEEKAAPVYARASGVVEADVEGVLVLLDTKNWDFIEFDKVGRTIWELLEEPKSPGELTDLLVQKFDVSHQQCGREARIFLDEMAAAGLVTVAA